MFAAILQSVIVFDLLINFFFHILQLRNFVQQKTQFHEDFKEVRDKIERVEKSTKELTESIRDDVETH